MLDLHLFRKPAFTGAQIVAFTLHASMFSMFLYIVALHAERARLFAARDRRALPPDLDPVLPRRAGGGQALRALPGARGSSAPASLLVGIGLLLMSGIEPSDDWTTLLAGFLVAGMGIGFINPPLATAAIGVVEPRRAGAASGINSTFRQVGMAVGIAGLGALLQSQGDRQPRHRPGGDAAPTWSGRSPRRGGFLGRRRGCRAGGPRRGHVSSSRPPRGRPSSTASTRSSSWPPSWRSWEPCSRCVLVRQRDFVTFPADAAP